MRCSCSRDISVQAQPTSTLNCPQAGLLKPLEVELDSKEAETGLEGQELLPIKPFLFIVELQLYADREALFKQNPPFDSTLSWRHAIGRVPISSPAHFIFVQCLIKSEPSADFWEGSWHVSCRF